MESDRYTEVRQAVKRKVEHLLWRVEHDKVGGTKAKTCLLHDIPDCKICETLDRR